MNVETTLRLKQFQGRHYQQDLIKAFWSGKFRKFICVDHRRYGKDFLWWNLTIRYALLKPCLCLYALPTFSQARSVIWEGKTNDGKNFLDEIPKECIAKIRHDTMTITLVNGSTIRLIGSDSYNTSIIGQNPSFIVFSEYALCDENAYKLAALPILKFNNGICALISTPRGKNSLYELYQIAKNSPEWYHELKTVEDTGLVSLEDIKKEINSGEISEDLALQEYWCSFERGSEHSYYAKYLDKINLKGQIGTVFYDPYHKVYTAWDLGIKDPTVIIFFQIIGEMIRIIDYYEAADKPMTHFAQIIHQRSDDLGYVYAQHFGPHDLMQRESARGLTKRELYKELGIKFSEPIFIEIEDGIELVRRNFDKLWIDREKCKPLLKALENYREEYDHKRKIYKGRPLHDLWSHACDSLRYLCAALPKTKDSMSADKLNKIYEEAMGIQSNMPAVFRDDLPEY